MLHLLKHPATIAATRPTFRLLTCLLGMAAMFLTGGALSAFAAGEPIVSKVPLHRGWNSVGLPVVPVEGWRASELLEDLNQAGIASEYALAYRQGAWKVYIDSIPATDFTLLEGDSVWLHVMASGEYVFEAEVPLGDLRLLHLSPDAGSVDLLAAEAVTAFSQIPYLQSSRFLPFQVGEWSLDLIENGAETPLANILHEVLAGEDYTLALTNPQNLGRSVIATSDDLGPISASRMRYRVIHAAKSLNIRSIFEVTNPLDPVELAANPSFGHVTPYREQPTGQVIIAADLDDEPSDFEVRFDLRDFNSGDIANVYITESPTGQVFAVVLFKDGTVRPVFGAFRKATLRLTNFIEDADYLAVEFERRGLLITRADYNQTSISALVDFGEWDLNVVAFRDGQRELVGRMENVSFQSDAAYTVTAYRHRDTNIVLMLNQDIVPPIPNDESRIRFVNLHPEHDQFAIFLKPNLDLFSPTVPYEGVSQYQVLPPEWQELWVDVDGDFVTEYRFFMPLFVGNSVVSMYFGKDSLGTYMITVDELGRTERLFPMTVERPGKLRFLHIAEGIGPVDVYQETRVKLFENVLYEQGRNYRRTETGAWIFYFVPAGADPNVPENVLLRFPLERIQGLGEDDNISLILMGREGSLFVSPEVEDYSQLNEIEFGFSFWNFSDSTPEINLFLRSGLPEGYRGLLDVGLPFNERSVLNYANRINDDIVLEVGTGDDLTKTDAYFDLPLMQQGQFLHLFLQDTEEGEQYLLGWLNDNSIIRLEPVAKAWVRYQGVFSATPELDKFVSINDTELFYPSNSVFYHLLDVGPVTFKRLDATLIPSDPPGEPYSHKTEVVDLDINGVLASVSGTLEEGKYYFLTDREDKRKLFLFEEQQWEPEESVFAEFVRVIYADSQPTSRPLHIEFRGCTLEIQPDTWTEVQLLREGLPPCPECPEDPIDRVFCYGDGVCCCREACSTCPIGAPCQVTTVTETGPNNPEHRFFINSPGSDTAMTVWGLADEVGQDSLITIPLLGDAQTRKSTTIVLFYETTLDPEFPHRIVYYITDDAYRYSEGSSNMGDCAFDPTTVCE